MGEHDDPALVITGMHRSGTSLAASLLGEAGVALGPELLPAMEHNARGHFEDLDFLALHDGALRRLDPSRRILWRPPERLRFDDAERERARELLEERRTRAPWGWKDPRTTLFLDEWAGLLPGARFLFLFRDPAEVVDSLWRRRDRALTTRILGRSLSPTRRRLDVFRPARALGAWLAYTRRILAFADAHPAACLLVGLDSLVADPQAILSHVGRSWALPLRAVEASGVFDPALLGRAPRSAARRVVDRHREARGLHRALCQRDALSG